MRGDPVWLHLFDYSRMYSSFQTAYQCEIAVFLAYIKNKKRQNGMKKFHCCHFDMHSYTANRKDYFSIFALSTTLLDVFQIRAEMYCRTLFGNHRRTGFGSTLTSKLKNPVV